MRILVEIAYQGNNFLGFKFNKMVERYSNNLKSYYNACIKDM